MVRGWAVGTSKDLYFLPITRDKRSIKLVQGDESYGIRCDSIAFSSRVSIISRGKGHDSLVFVLTGGFLSPWNRPWLPRWNRPIQSRCQTFFLWVLTSFKLWTLSQSSSLTLNPITI